MRKGLLTIKFLVFYGALLLLVPGNAYSGAEHVHEHHTQQAPGVSDEAVIAGIKTEPEKLIAGNPETIVISLKDQAGKPLEDLAVHHDRLIHVVIASQDFTVFAHIHPEDFGPITEEMKKSGRYPVRFTFPKGGRYIIGIDFAVKEQLFSRHFEVEVAGEPGMGILKEDLSGRKRFGGLDVTFTAVPEQITPGKEVTLRYLFSKNGEPVSALEPYLSAPMHLAVISADLAHFMHTHGEIPGMQDMGHEHHMHMKMAVPEKFGPEIDVRVIFPGKGLYQIFGQVGYQGKVIDTSFMVRVE